MQLITAMLFLLCVYENKIKIKIEECKNVLDIVICHLETDA